VLSTARVPIRAHACRRVAARCVGVARTLARCPLGVYRRADVTSGPSEKKRSRRRGRPHAVALTGVHGPVGVALVRRLDEDERVSKLVLIDRYAPALPLRKAVFAGVNLTATLADVAVAEVLARERIETVVHAAFHAVPAQTLEAAHELEVIGTRALLRAVADNIRHVGTVTNLVVLGTTMSYGAHPDNPQYLREDAPLRGGPGYPFVADKVAVESEVAAFRRRTALPTAVVRACWTVGDARTLAARVLAPLVVPAVLGRDPLVQLLHVEDLVDAVRLAAHGAHDGAFNVAGGGVLPLSTIVKLAGRLRAPMSGSSVRATLQALWRLGVGLVPGGHADYLADTFVADVDRAAAVLGFRPRYSTRAALARHLAARRGGAHLAA
jgi:UDP-glucose 4-epimerase